MIDGSEKRNRQLAFELQNSHVCEKRSKQPQCLRLFPLRKRSLPFLTDDRMPPLVTKPLVMMSVIYIPRIKLQ